jgi:hypothetical protein
MKKSFIKIIGFTFALALVLNVAITDNGTTENPPLHGANTITQIYIS